MALSACCLFDGYGGFELGARLAGIDWRTVVRVERDAHAAATLVARMEEAHLDQAPIWDDITTFDGRPWHRKVDIVTAGFNCQPFSSAGQRRGVDDERWLWPDIARIVAEVGARFVWLENVPDVVRLGGADRVCGDLAALGFDAEWGCYSAAAVGAPHRRNRWWLLAHRPGLRRLDASIVLHDDRDGRAESSRSRHDVGGSNGSRTDTHATTRQPRTTTSESSENVADADGQGNTRHPRRTGTEHAGPLISGSNASGIDEREPHHETRAYPRVNARHGVGGRSGWPPRPDDHHGWADWITEGGPEPQIRRVTDGPPTGLAESLHLGGNGLVPQVAGAALQALVDRAGTSEMKATTPTSAVA